MGYEQAVARTAKAMISRFGVPGVFTRATGIDYNATDGSVAVAEQAYECRMTVGPVDRKLLSPQTSSAQITIAAEGLAFDPQLGDRVSALGKSYVVKEVRRVYASGALVLYTLGVGL